MLLIDTNIFIDTFFDRNNTFHKSCLSLMRLLKDGQLTAVVPGLVIAEVAWLLHSYYDLDKETICNLLESIESLKGITIVDGYNYSLALSLYKANHVKYIDACIASLPSVQKGRAVIISNDKDFDKLGVKRLLPGDV